MIQVFIALAFAAAPLPAFADDSGEPSTAAIIAAIGQFATVIAVITVFIKLGYKNGTQDESLRAAKETIAKLESKSDTFATKAALEAHKIDDDKMHAALESKESIVLRLSAMESKVERDVERELHRREREKETT